MRIRRRRPIRLDRIGPLLLHDCVESGIEITTEKTRNGADVIIVIPIIVVLDLTVGVTEHLQDYGHSYRKHRV